MQSIVYKISLFMLSLLTWVVLPSHAAPSALKVSQCTDTVVAIHEHLESYSDASAELSFSDILRLDNPQWQPVDRGSLTPGFSRAAHWYRFSLDNSTQSTCRFWLDLGSLHMTDVQMFTQQAGEAWQSQKWGWLTLMRSGPVQSAIPVCLLLSQRRVVWTLFFVSAVLTHSV